VTPLRIGTRGSKLALWQANTVSRLITEGAGVQCEIVIIRTSGDESSGPPDPPPTSGTLGTPGPPGTSVKGMFVKEIEDALLTGDVDLAVHSSKDLSAVLPSGLSITAALPREDPRDAVLLPNGDQVPDLDALKNRLGAAPRVGTSSVRRVAQLTSLFPDALFAPLRGNVDTRIRKLDSGECDGAVLASAGLKRLGLASRISLALPIDVCIPAPGQGIVSIEIRDDRSDVKSALKTINQADAMDALMAERAVVSALGGNCQMPLGAHARLEGDDLVMAGIVTSHDGHEIVRAEHRGSRQNACAVGEALAQSLIALGALKILNT
jgi:hydroxymethylbilane synthase